MCIISSATVTTLQKKMEVQVTANTLTKEDLCISKNQVLQLQQENERLKEENDRIREEKEFLLKQHHNVIRVSNCHSSVI